MADRLLGRETELALITELLVSAQERGGALVFHGEPGIGKSTLAKATIRHARELGSTVLTTTGVRTDAAFPYSGLHQLVWPVLGELARLPGPQRSALEAALGADEGPVDAYRAGLALLTLLGDVAEHSPVVVVAEDAHWVDAPTCEVLAFVARRIEADAVAMLITSREEIPRSIRGAGLPMRRLQPLTPEAADALLHALDPALAPAVRRQIFEQAAGNPLGLVELLSEAARGVGQPALPAWLPLTTRLERTFSARVADLPPTTRVALLVAALSDPAALDEVLAAAREVAGEPITLAAFTPAVEAGLLEVDELRVAFAHPLVRTAVAQRATDGLRRAVHAALADTLAASPGRAIWHRVAGVEAPDDALADELATLARSAIARGSVISAAETLGRAGTLTSDPIRRGGRLLDAAEIALEVGRGDLVEQLLSDADLLPLGPADQARRRWLHDAARVQAPSPAWFEVYLERTEGLLAAGDAVRGGQALLTVAFRCWWADVPAATRARIVALARTLASGALVRTIVESLVDPVGSRAQVADALRTLDLEAVPSELLRLAAVSAAVVGEFDRGVVIADRAIERLRARGRYGLLAPALAGRAWSGVYAGDWGAALAAATEAAAISRETAQPLWTVSATAAQATLTALRGDPERGAELAEAALALLPPGAADGMRALVELARATAHLAAERPDEALVHFTAILDPAQPWHSAFVARWVVADAAEAAHRAGDRDALAAIVRFGCAAAASAHLHAATAYAALLADEDAPAEAALPACAGLPALRARVQLAHGARLHRRRRTNEARPLLRGARETFQALGMTAFAERARQELRAAGESVHAGPVDASQLLTPQELQIARLAADGLSNREIGATLYLSHRTVGSHLYRVFPKLGVTSRGELRALLA
ncbi:AAA family ATPase [Solirubrobacter sp. CPCC 204708]|uniref:AAA family ATPase n=1 Tax=Solirubrobacter deserti TaxID=2282478 RepID=A0ABT4RJ64_9ACTN|nr:LuxR family transcriptional regulator [Solirubrobacter deserti]MBE2317646.1 AAA family ATPase [Solirubrobacter deserti]MDA0138596.1 AAA family ATPase [Solirubrobacter deserti]